ncbi:MAG TPA: phosphate starvation-inducible protein PhoH, partial [Pusillimonas sp.]|nr:phosphate starvation-inducible protein PhoH [Pusillimonas sp.]
MTRSSRRHKPVTVRLDGDNMHLANLCGPLDENLRQIADGWNVLLNRRGSHVSIEGEQAKAAAQALEWFHERAVHKALTIDDIQLGMVELGAGRSKADDPRKIEPLPELPPVDDQ